jgi:hypothetical protein
MWIELYIINLNVRMKACQSKRIIAYHCRGTIAFSSCTLKTYALQLTDQIVINYQKVQRGVWSCLFHNYWDWLFDSFLFCSDNNFGIFWQYHPQSYARLSVSLSYGNRNKFIGSGTLSQANQTTTYLFAEDFVGTSGYLAIWLLTFIYVSIKCANLRHFYNNVKFS